MLSGPFRSSDRGAIAIEELRRVLPPSLLSERPRIEIQILTPTALYYRLTGSKRQRWPQRRYPGVVGLRQLFQLCARFSNCASSQGPRAAPLVDTGPLGLRRWSQSLNLDWIQKPEGTPSNNESKKKRKPIRTIHVLYATMKVRTEGERNQHQPRYI